MLFVPHSSFFILHFIVMVHLIFSFQINLLLGVIARFLRITDTPGMLAGVAAGTVILHWAGVPGYAPFAACALAAGVLVWLRRRPNADASQPATITPPATITVPATITPPSIADVAAYCLAPTLLATLWNALPDPQLGRVGAISGFAATLAAFMAAVPASAPRPPPQMHPEAPSQALSGTRPRAALGNRWLNALGLFIPALGGAGAIGLIGLASGAIRFWHVWIVLLSVSAGLVLAGIAGVIVSRVTPRMAHGRRSRWVLAVRALIITVAGSLLGVALAYASRS